MAVSKKATYLALSLGLLGGLVALAAWRPVPDLVRRVARKPPLPSTLDDAPPEVREFLNCVLEQVPEGGTGVTGYQFRHWEREGRPTHEAIGLKAVAGVDPEEAIARVMDVDGYRGKIAHVVDCRSERDRAFQPPEKVRFHQLISVPGIAKVQHELVLVDAGTIKGYRVAYWYLLKKETEALDPKRGARSEFSVGAWLVAPGVVGYALSSWPRLCDLNIFQWVSLTSGADVLAKKVVEGNINGLAEWAKTRTEISSLPR